VFSRKEEIKISPKLKNTIANMCKKITKRYRFFSILISGRISRRNQSGVIVAITQEVMNITGKCLMI